MRYLVCGSRKLDNKDLVNDILKRYDITELIEGGAKGADTLAREWAETRGIPVKTFKAQWNLFGNDAGPIRNQQMLDEGKPYWVIAFLAPDSVGTRDMILRAQKANKPVTIVDIVLSLGSYVIKDN